MSQPARSLVAAPPNLRTSQRRRSEALDGYLMLLPTILGIGLFFIVPLGISLYLSFTDSRLVGTPKFIGVQNYSEAISNKTFHQALGNTAFYSVLMLILSIFPALWLAILLNKKIRGRAFFRAVFFVPVVASVVGISLLWRYLLNFDFGLINHFISLLGLPKLEWLNSSKYALLSVTLVSAWRTIGYNLVIFLAGLQAIPAQLYEAASIDGASRARQFWNITLPLLSPTTFFISVTTLINSLQGFNEMYALGVTRSGSAGPSNSMLTIVFYLYQQGFSSFRMGYASAVAWLLFLIIMVITAVQFRVSRRWVNYD